MFIATITLLVPFLMVTFLPLVLKAFSSEELNRMGVQLEGAEPESYCDANHILPNVSVVCGND